MKGKLENVAAIFAAVESGDYCDVGHFYCPWITREGEVDVIHFPSGAVVHRDGSFAGPPRLYEKLSLVPADYRPAAIHPFDRYPEVREEEARRRVCACGAVEV